MVARESTLRLAFGALLALVIGLGLTSPGSFADGQEPGPASDSGPADESGTPNEGEAAPVPEEPSVDAVQQATPAQQLGNPLGAATSFAIGVGANPGAIDLDTEVRRFHEKVAAGAEFVLTQPVYEAKLLEDFPTMKVCHLR